MIRTILYFLVFILAASGASAQKLAIGEKVPDIKVAEWYKGQAPSAGKATFVDFFHSGNSQCVKALPRINSMQDKYGSSLNVVVLSREELDKISSYVNNYSFYTGYDEGGKTFVAYEVRFVPFSVLIDPRGRLVWMGNINSLQDSIIEKALK